MNKNMSENAAFEAPTKLWSHSNPNSTQIYAFKEHIAQKYQLTLPSYHELWQWSVDHPALFWEEIWHQTAIIAAKSYNFVRLHGPSSSIFD
jgi:acetoacetyl-CoA synthetase